MLPKPIPINDEIVYLKGKKNYLFESILLLVI